MKSWPKFPLIYEINTWVWLEELGQKSGYPINLAIVPDAEWESIASLGFDAVWLMGIWERSPMGKPISMANENLCADFQRALPVWTFIRLRQDSFQPVWQDCLFIFFQKGPFSTFSPTGGTNRGETL